MSNTEITPGDVVELNSGGPNMTVLKIYDSEGIKTAHCAWFSNDSSCYNYYAVVGLTLKEKKV